MSTPLTPDQQSKFNLISEMLKEPVLKQALKTAIIDTISAQDALPERSKGPYYKEIYALELKPILDAMLEDRKDRVFYIDDFPGVQIRTLYLRLDQAFRYLCDVLDTDDLTYTRMRASIQISTSGRLAKRHGIYLRFKNNVLGANAKFPSHVIDQEATHEWRHTLEEFILDGPIGKKFELSDIELSEAEQLGLEAQLCTIPDLLYKVSPNKILIVKQPPPNESEVQ